MSVDSEGKGFSLLWTFNTDIKAEQAKILLEENGFFAHLNNSYSARFNEGVAFMANAGINGGVRLFTKKSQAYDAYVLLAMHELVPMRDITPSPTGIDKFQKLLRNIPVLRSLGILIQLLVVSVLITIIILLVYYLIIMKQQVS
tara:strand:- start:162 stop:593 length:432 start_codon:yes stop_codon:yes gene_type:complete